MFCYIHLSDNLEGRAFPGVNGAVKLLHPRLHLHTFRVKAREIDREKRLGI